MTFWKLFLSFQGGIELKLELAFLFPQLEPSPLPNQEIPAEHLQDKAVYILVPSGLTDSTKWVPPQGHYPRLSLEPSFLSTLLKFYDSLMSTSLSSSHPWLFSHYTVVLAKSINHSWLN